MRTAELAEWVRSGAFSGKNGAKWNGWNVRNGSRPVPGSSIRSREKDHEKQMLDGEKSSCGTGGTGGTGVFVEVGRSGEESRLKPTHESPEMTPQDGISVSAAAHPGPGLLNLIQQHRAGLVEFLAAQAAPTDPTPEPASAPAADPDELWRQADRAYLGHHFGCRTCCSAGKGYGQRCPIGLELWTAYEAACDTRHAHTTPTRGRNPR